MRTDSYEKKMGYQRKPFGFMRMDTTEAAYLIAPGSIDGIMIDAQHNYTDVLADLKMWQPKLKKGEKDYSALKRVPCLDDPKALPEADKEIEKLLPKTANRSPSRENRLRMKARL